MLTTSLIAALLATHAPTDMIVNVAEDRVMEPSQVTETNTSSTRLDGVTVETQSGRVRVLTDSQGNRRFLFEDGLIIAVDSSGKTWNL